MTDQQRKSPAISPLYADLTGLPPALFLVGDLDPALDYSKTMFQRWRSANCNAEIA